MAGELQVKAARCGALVSEVRLVGEQDGGAFLGEIP